MENIHKLIEATIRYLEAQTTNIGTPDPFPSTESIAIGAALLSLFGLVFTTIYTVRKNTKLQNANARIEWIQKVRNVTAELIVTYYSALNEDDLSELQKDIIKARGLLEQLILYFGPERKIIKANSNLFETKLNKGKNDQIVTFLIELSNDFVIYNTNLQRGIITNAEARLNRTLTELQGNILGTTSQEIVEVDGQPETNTEYAIAPEAERNFEQANSELDKIRTFNDSLDKKLNELRNIMRIYLKSEWTKAKKGK